MTVEGNLDIFQLTEILQLIAQQQKTGILTVQGEDDIIAVSFLKGKVVGADSLHHTSEEKLAAILVEQGAVGQGVIDDLLREQAASGSRLQDLLLEGQHVDRAQLLAGLRRQYSDLLTGLLNWDQGDFKFYSNDEVSYEEGFEPLSVQAILLDAGAEAVSRPAPSVPASPSAPTSQSSAPRGDQLDAQIPELSDLGLTPPPLSGNPAGTTAGHSAGGTAAGGTAAGGTAAGDTAAGATSGMTSLLDETSTGTPSLASVYERRPADSAKLGQLSPEAKEVLRHIDGRATLAVVVVSSGIDEQETLRIVQGLQQAGLVRLRPTTSAASSASASATATSATATGTSVASPALDELEIEGLQEDAGELDGAAAPAPLLDSTVLPMWLARGIAALAALWLIAALFLHPRALSLPFPWQESQREVFAKQQRKIAYFKVDRALKTNVLFTGQLPDDLATLSQGGLLPAADLRDPGGKLFVYQAGDGRYRLSPQQGNGDTTALGTTEAITGNFILDPGFFTAKAAAEEAPLVLLD